MNVVEALLNIPAVHCRILLLITLVSLLPFHALALELEIRVSGLEKELLKNTMARLELNLHRENPHLKAHDVQRLHRQAPGDIRGALAPFGYYSPTIESKLSKDGDGFVAEYSVQPGEPVRVKLIELRVEGPGKERLADVPVSFPLVSGDILDQRKYEDGKNRMLRAAVRSGFMKAQFTRHELRVNRSSREAEINLTLATGPQFVFGPTTFEQSHLPDELLTRYLPYREGDPYMPARLLELQKALYQTEYFSSVEVDGLVGGADNPVVPVVVRLVLPEKRNRYGVGLGYATDTGARARFEWRNRLLNSYGHRMRGTAQASEQENQLTLNYEVPWGNPLRDSLSYTGSYYDQIWDDTDTRLLSAGVQLEHRSGFITHAGGMEIRDEDYSVGVTSGQSTLFMPSYSATMAWADDLLNTGYGVRLSLGVSGASELLGSDSSFLKLVANGKVIFTPMPGWRLIGRGSLGAALVESIDELPPSLRFYAGGDQSIRGYGYKEIGTEDESGAVIGGRYLVVGSVELEKQLTDSFSAALFWDVGNATDDLSLSFKQGAGVGVRYRLPFGQIRVDVASAILEEDTPVRLHLSVGADL